MNLNYYIKCSTVQEKVEAVELLSKLTGLLARSVNVASGSRVGEFPYVYVNWERNWIGAKRYDSSFAARGENVLDFKDINRIFLEDGPTRIKLNDQYTAEVSAAGIKVGCQTFSFEKIEELYRAALKFQDKSDTGE